MPTSLAQFLHAAKRATYAAQGDSASITPLVQGTKQLEYAKDEYLYRDIYAGMNHFVGQELVYRSGQPIWSMSYAGGLVVEATGAAVGAIYGFLRSALRQCPQDLPLRGPSALEAGELAYALELHGSLEHFSGIEKITLAGSIVYELHVAGGTLR